MPSAQQLEAEHQANELLRELTHWERLGVTDASVPLKSTGEDNARIAELRRQLIGHGVRFHRTAQGYVLDGIAQGPGAEGPPDATIEAGP